MYQATLTAGQTSQPMQAGTGSICRLTISSGSGYVQYTTGSFADIGNNVATWTTWPKGAVSATTTDTAGYPMIVRFVCVSGTVAVLLADPSEAEFPANAAIPWESQQSSFSTDASGNVTGLVGPGGNVGPTLYTVSASMPECVLMGSNTNIWIDSGVTLTNSGTFQHTMFRTGNAEFSSVASPIPGVSIYCADEQAAGDGTMRYTSGTTSLAWRSPGDTIYGPEVNISGVTNAATVAIFKLASASATKSIYVYVAPATRSTVERTVKVAEVTGAKAVTWSRTSNVTTVTEAGHQRRVGDFVILFNDTTAMRHGYISAVSASTWTIADTGSNASGSARAYGVRNIRINGNGATLDYNKNGLTISLMSNLHAIILNAVSDVTVEGLQVNNCTKYACLVTGYKNAMFRNFSTYRSVSSDFSGNSDVIHPLGPGRHFVAEDTRAQGGDNIFGIGCADFYDYVFNCPQYGDLSLTDGRITGVWCEDTDEQPVRFYNANGTNVIRNWVVDGVFGTYGATVDSAVAIIMDTMSGGMVDSGQTNIDGLVVISPDAVRSDGTHSFAIKVAGAGTRRNLRFDRVRPRPGNTTLRGTVWFDTGTSAEDASVSFEGGNFSGYLVGITGATTVGRLTVRSTGVLNGDNALGATQRPVVVALDSSTTVLTYLDIGGLVVDDTSSSGTKTSVVWSTGTIGEAVISDVIMLDGDAVVRGNTGAVAGGVLRLRNINANAGFVAVYDAGTPANVAMDTVWHNNAANAVFTTNESTARSIIVRAANCRGGNRFLRNVQGNHTWTISGYGNAPGAGAAIVTDAGTPAWRLDGDWDLITDGALLDATVTNHRAGAKFYNTNGAFGVGVGGYVRGSAAWVRVAS